VVERALRRRVNALFSLWGVRPARSAEEISRGMFQAREEAQRVADASDFRSPNYHAIARRAAEEAGLSPDHAQVSALWEAHNAGGPLLGRRILDDTHETLEWLLERGFRVGAITNRAHGGESFLAELQYHDLLRYFEVVSSSDQVGWRKPHRRIFQHALGALGVAPAESALVGDRPEADVRGARAMGMTAILMRGVSPPDRVPQAPDEEPDYTIDSLSELRQLPPFARA
jgi:HAD superfamily hydrolase (TIGR01549 family)